MKEEWLFPGAMVPVDVETTAALVTEIKRLIDVVGGMALAQQEPVAWMEMVVANLVREGVNKHNARELAEHFYTAPPAAQPAQEPVACIVKGCENYKNQGRFVGNLCSSCYGFLTTGDGKYSQAYCNTQRQWVGLMDEEMKDALTSVDAETKRLPPGFRDFAQAIEAKLKEKNT